jgi:hypothetical protein
MRRRPGAAEKEVSVKNKLILAGVLAAILPSAALAQPPDPNCVASNNASRAQGTILGAGAGALIGSVLAGRHSRGAGAVLGAVGGGIGGNVIAGSRNDPCPPGYYYGPNGPPPGPGYGPPPPSGFWNGAPGDVRQRIDWMQNRIDRMANDGRLSPDESQRAYAELRSIRYYARSNYQRYGALSPDQRGYIQARLDHLSQSIHWMARTGY